MSPATARQHAHDLIERMPGPQIAAVARLLEVMLDPVSGALAAAPVEREAISAAEEREAAQSRRWLATHRGVPLEAVKAEMERGARPRRSRQPRQRR